MCQAFASQRLRAVAARFKRRPIDRRQHRVLGSHHHALPGRLGGRQLVQGSSLTVRCLRFAQSDFAERCTALNQERDIIRLIDVLQLIA